MPRRFSGSEAVPLDGRLTPKRLLALVDDVNRLAAAARLRDSEAPARQAGPDKHEASGVAAPKASTNSNTDSGGAKWLQNRV